jgi:hypothetical protein
MNLTFESWELQARIAMAKEEINWDVADPLIEDAKRHWEASGQDPWAACGSPAEFATAAAAEQPVDRKATLDREGFTARGYLTNMFFVLNVIAIPWSLVVAVFTGSWSFTLTPARLIGSLLFTVTFILLLGLPRAIRTSGRPGQALWALPPIVAMMALTAAAFTFLPKTDLVSIPVLGFDLAAVILMLLQLGPAKPTRSETEAEPVMDNDAWFGRLRGLLVGRHDLPPDRAAALVAQARDHASESSSAAIEFGPVEIYAAEISERETVHEFPVWIKLDKIVFVVFSLLLFHQHLSDHLDDRQAGLTVALVIGVPVLTVLGAAWALVRRGRGRPVDTTD